MRSGGSESHIKSRCLVSLKLQIN